MLRQSPSLFLSYRRCDEPWAVALLDVELSRRFGDHAVFLDNRSVPAGAAFDEALLAAVRASEVLIVVIGERWLTASDHHGRRLVDSPKDWVRREIVTAFETGATVLPVLLGDVSPVRAEMLPPPLRRLAFCQAVRLRPSDLRQDLAALAARLPVVVG